MFELEAALEDISPFLFQKTFSILAGAATAAHLLFSSQQAGLVFVAGSFICWTGARTLQYRTYTAENITECLQHPPEKSDSENQEVQLKNNSGQLRAT